MRGQVYKTTEMLDEKEKENLEGNGVNSICLLGEKI